MFGCVTHFNLPKKQFYSIPLHYLWLVQLHSTPFSPTLYHSFISYRLKNLLDYISFIDNLLPFDLSDFFRLSSSASQIYAKRFFFKSFFLFFFYSFIVASLVCCCSTPTRSISSSFCVCHVSQLFGCRSYLLQ